MSEADILTFPCEFPIKVMGHADEDFEREVIAIVRKHAPDLSESAISKRPSGKGNYLAITLTVTASSKEQLDKIYLELNAHKSVVMTL